MIPFEEGNPQERYLWFVALLNVGWEEPPRQADPEWWEWQTFAADWTRELLQGVRTSA